MRSVLRHREPSSTILATVRRSGHREGGKPVPTMPDHAVLQLFLQLSRKSRESLFQLACKWLGTLSENQVGG
jgi:hypothetical protein